MNRIDRVRGSLVTAGVAFGLSALSLLLYVAVYARGHQFHYRCPGPEPPWGLLIGGLVCTAVALTAGALPAVLPAKDADRGWRRAQSGMTILWLGLILADVFVGLAAVFWLIQMQCGLD
ncbi:MAG TPA: hypothetical protein VK771_04575 [Acidimicrobiia bacterium]|nr:hypothetical protein [Acidimicrobiia bacterium]